MKASVSIECAWLPDGVRRRLPAAFAGLVLLVAVALATAGSIYFVFGRWLKVPLPTGVLGF